MTRFNTAGYTPEFIARHQAEIAAHEAEEAERERQKAEAQRRFDAELAAQREAEERRHQALVEQALAPRKLVEQRAWLAAHPDKKEADFERIAWPHLKANILDADREEQLRQSAERLRNSGQYRL